MAQSTRLCCRQRGVSVNKFALWWGGVVSRSCEQDKCAKVALVDNTYFTSSSHRERDVQDLGRNMDICHRFCKPRRRGHCSM
jgi:hypothetical protein